MYRNTFALVDNSKLKENIKEIINKYDNYKYYIGVVKANAYGHGDYIINDLIDSGINYLAVSSLEEALSIRRYNKEIPILCLEVIDIRYLDVVIYNNITMTNSSLDYVLELVKENDINRLKVHLKLDVGMNRLGLKDRDEVNKVIRLFEDNEIYLEGIYTHFPTSGINDRYYEKGLDKFRELTKDIDLDKIYEKGYTSKKDSAEKHGLGLWTVRKILINNNNLNLFTSKNDLFCQQLEIYDM